MLFPFWHACFCVVKVGGILVPDSATVNYGQRYNRKAGSSPSCQVSEKKTQKVMLKIHFGQGKYGMLRQYHKRIYKY